MSRIATVLGIGIVLLSPPFGQAQCPGCAQKTEQKPAARELHQTQSVLIKSVDTGGILGPLTCDDKGNLYFRTWSNDVFRAPLIKVSPKGEKLATFSLASEPEFAKYGTGMHDFTVADTGEVDELAVGGATPKEAANYVVHFDKDGSLKSKTKLAGLFGLQNYPHSRPVSS